MTHLFLLTALSMVLPVAALGSTTNTERPCATTSKTPVAAAKKPLAKTTGSVRTTKGGIGAQVRYSMAEPVVGSPLQVSLNVSRTAASNTPLSMQFKSDATMPMAGRNSLSLQQDTPTGDYTVTLTPLSEGLHYIHVFLSSDSKSTALAIPVQVGKTRGLEKTGQIETMPDGQRVISIPAQQ